MFTATSVVCSAEMLNADAVVLAKTCRDALLNPLGRYSHHQWVVNQGKCSFVAVGVHGRLPRNLEHMRSLTQ